MINEGYLRSLDKPIKTLIFLFVITLSLGFFTAINFVHFSTSGTPEGISQNYLGNEEDEEAEVLKFKKSKHEMLSITHTHLLSMSIIFFMLGILVYGCQIPSRLKTFLLFEPMLSVLVTFSSIYLLWIGYGWTTYIIILSGTLMTLSFFLSVVLILFNLLKTNIDT